MFVPLRLFCRFPVFKIWRRFALSHKRQDVSVPDHAMLIKDLWSEHRARLRGYIAKRVRENDAIDDILQTVFLKTSENLQTLRARGSVSAWLYRIAANAIADHYRSLRPYEELPDEIAAPEFKRDYVAELAPCLQPLIANLPTTYRSALMLSEIEGLPQREVADRLSISLSGAKSRVQRGRKKLRQRLLECCAIEIGQGGITGYERRDKNRKCSCE